MADNESLYRDHFTPSDRRELIQTGERLAGLKEDFAELKRTIEAGGRHHADAVRQMEVDIKTDARRIEVEFKGAIERLYSQAQATQKENEGRIRSLENFRWYVLGASAGVGALAGFLARFFHS